MPPQRYGKPRHRNWYKTEHEDVAWFRRIRQCQSCGESFASAETDEALLEELVELRRRVASRNQERVAEVRRRVRWLNGKDTVPRELADGLIRSSAWWLTHSSGRPVRAPGHAENLFESSLGWAVEFGANTFLVGLAFKRCRNEINSYLDQAATGKIPLLSDLKAALALHIRGAVANYDGYEYEGYYPITDGRLIFGAQAIDVSEATNFILERAKLDGLLA
jgi:hypothetical protein